MDAGIVEITAENFGTKDSNAANTAAIRITLGSYTRDSSYTPVFSPYVVFAGPPINPAKAVARPSPNRVRCNPGSSI